MMSSASAIGTPPAVAAGPQLLLLPGTLCDARLVAPLLDRLPGQAATVVDLTGATSARLFAERVLTEAPSRSGAAAARWLDRISSVAHISVGAASETVGEHV